MCLRPGLKYTGSLFKQVSPGLCSSNWAWFGA